MSNVYVVGLSTEGNHLLSQYLDSFMPDAMIIPWGSAGIKGKIKNYVTRPDTLFLIIDETLYKQCEPVCGDVLQLPKVHKYVDDDGLKQFLISKFGMLEGVETSSYGTVLPDELLSHENTDSIAIDEVIESEDIAVLKDKLAQADLTIRNLSAQLEENSTGDEQVMKLANRIKELKGELEEKDKLLSTMQGSSSELMSKLSKTDRALQDAEQLRNDLRTVKESCSALEFERNKLQSALDLSEKHVSELQSKVTALEEEKVKIEGDIIELTNINNRLSNVSDSSVNDLQNLQKEYDEEKARLASEIKSLNSKLDRLSGVEVELDMTQSELGKAKLESSNLRVDLESLQTELQKSKNKLDEYRNQISSMMNENRSLSDKINFLQSQIDSLTYQLSSQTGRTEETDGRIEELNAKLKEMSNSLAKNEEIIVSYNTAMGEKDEEISKLTADNVKLTNEVDGLNSQLAVEKAENDKMTSIIAQHEDDLAESKKELAALQSNANTEQLEAENADLKSKLSIIRRNSVNKTEYDKLLGEFETLKTSAVDSEEVAQLKTDLESAQKLISKLQLEMQDNADTLKEMYESPFVKMADVAMPKINYEVDIPVAKPQGNFIVIGGGSLESQNNVFQLIRNSCLANNGKKYLIVDLSLDTRIDIDFGMKNVVSPINWLNGSDSFRNYVNNTMYPNIKTLTIGTAYMNDLYLLNVDWSTRFAELQGLADAVIINVGCINSLIPKVLFNSFSKVMKGFVVVKSTPANLRAAFINMTSFKAISPSVIIKCYDFDKTASTPLYTRLANKFKADILNNSDTLNFFKEVK